MTSPNMVHAISYVRVIADPSAKDDLRLKAAQELGEHFEQYTSSASFKSFVEQNLKIFIKVLQEESVQFISENNIQQVKIEIHEIFGF